MVDFVDVTKVGIGVVQVAVLCGIFARLGNHAARLVALEKQKD